MVTPETRAMCGVFPMRILAGLVAAALFTSNAVAADLRVYTPPATAFGGIIHPLPDCTDSAVLGDIAHKFAYQDTHIVHSGLAVVGVDSIRQTRFKDGPSLTDVRYCIGRAWLSNGRTSEVVFIIEGPMKGKYSLGYAVESCLPGFDPFRVYDGNCRSIRG
jgi:hypothetical protein